MLLLLLLEVKLALIEGVTVCEEGKWSLVEETCKRTAYSELCVASLESSPAMSDVTDLRGVAQVMTGIVLAKAAETLEAIRAVLKSGASEAAVEKSLAYCAELYIPLVKYTLPQAIDALTGGHFGFAGYGISDAAKQASTCAKTISSANSSVIADQNQLLGRLSQIAASIVQILLQP